MQQPLMTRALLVVVLIAGQLPAAAARRRAVLHPSAPVQPPAIVAAAREAAAAALGTGVPAVQIAVSDHGRIIYSEAFGMTDRENATAATPRSLLQIASVWKQFTAAAILRLAERGSLTLDDRIDQHVKDFDARGQPVTVRHLLTHTSGIRREWYGSSPPLPDLTAPATREVILAALNGEGLFDAPPGVRWSYSNAGYMLLGFAVESITGTPFAEFIRDEFVLPLGLLDTGVCGTFHLSQPQGYRISSGEWVRTPSLHASAFLASAGLCSTASDLARWSHDLATGRAILSASYTTMTTPARLSDDTIVPNGYAFGVLVGNVLGHAAVWHDGAIFGFQSYLLYFPDRDIGVAVVTNAYPAPAAGHPTIIAMAVAEAALAAP